MDDMIPDRGIPGRAELLEKVLAFLARQSDLIVTGLPWATGVVIAARRG